MDTSDFGKNVQKGSGKESKMTPDEALNKLIPHAESGGDVFEHGKINPSKVQIWRRIGPDPDAQLVGEAGEEIITQEKGCCA